MVPTTLFRGLANAPVNYAGAPIAIKTTIETIMKSNINNEALCFHFKNTNAIIRYSCAAQLKLHNVATGKSPTDTIYVVIKNNVCECFFDREEALRRYNANRNNSLEQAINDGERIVSDLFGDLF